MKIIMKIKEHDFMSKTVLKLFSVALVITLFAAMFATPAADIKLTAAENIVAEAPAEEETTDAVTTETTEADVDDTTEPEEGPSVSVPATTGLSLDNAFRKDMAGFMGIQKWFYNLINSILDTVLRGVVTLLPVPSSWVNKEDYVTKNFYDGMDSFLTEPAEEAVWNVGYASASLVEGFDFQKENFYMGGYFHYPPLKSQGYLDDLRVRVYAINDNSGRGTALFAILDGSGFTNTDVRAVRALLADYAAEHDIVSINIAATHVHSAVDIQGLGGDIAAAFTKNPLNVLLGRDAFRENGKSKKYMDNLFAKTVECIKAAVEDLKPGTLYYSDIDASEYIKDKRKPIVFDPNLNTFKFVPADGSTETYIVNFPSHLTGMPQSNDMATSDYMYYLEEGLKNAYAEQEKDVNLAFMLGANLAMSTERAPLDLPADTPAIEAIAAYGHRLSELILDESNVWNEIAPLFNIKTQEIFIKIENPILLAAGKTGLVNNTAVRTGPGAFDVAMVSEMSYVELGTDDYGFAFALMPGEVAPELAWGGTMTADEAWNGYDWELPEMADMVGGRRLLVCSQMNDAVGYIVPDNDYGPWLEAEEHYEETLSLGPHAASTFVNLFSALVDSVKNANV